MSGDHNTYASGSSDGQRSGWRKRTIMEMAREAQLPYFYQTGDVANLKQLEAFAELVRADAIAEEREACAKVCKKHGYDHYCEHITNKIAETIRARGQA